MSVRWDKQSIEVCWGKNVHLPLTRIKPEHLNSDEQFFNNQENDKKIIKDAIVSNYNFDSTGIELTGWRNCDDNPGHVNEDVILLLNSAGKYDETSDSRASIGKNSNKKSFVLIRKLSVAKANFLKPDEHLKFISLHEFGHLLGLRHEDSHPEAPIRSQEALSENVLILSGYDSMSVMSYRFMDTMMGITGHLFKLDPTNKVTPEETWKWNFPQSQMFALSRFSDILAPSFLDDSRVAFLSQTEDLRRFSLAIAPSDKDLKTLRCAYIENCTLNP
jgi:hypothetical protein